MKTGIIFIVLLLFSKTALSQNNPGDSFVITNRSTTIVDSIKPKKTDSLPYATLHFYRSYIPKFNAPLKKVPIYINDSLIYRLKANNVISLKVFKEGKFNIAIDEKGESEIQIKVKFGQEYFFKCEVVNGLWFGKPTIESVKADLGRSESGILKSE